MLHRVQAKRIDAVVGPAQFLVSDSCFAQTIDVLKARAEPLGIEIVMMPGTKLADVSFGERVFGALVQTPDEAGRVHDLARVHRPRETSGVLVAVGTDLLEPRAADAAGRARRRRGLRQLSALRRAARLRRPARRVLRDARKARAAGARTNHRRFDRRARQHRLPDVAADARAAHPAGEGDVEHLHRAGAARQYRRTLRRVSRSQGPDADRQARSRVRQAARRELARLGYSELNDTLLRHAAIPGSGRRTGGRPDRKGRARARRSTSDIAPTTASQSRSTKRSTSATSVHRVSLRGRREQGGAELVEAGRDERVDGLPAQLGRKSPFLTHPVFNKYHSEIGDDAIHPRPRAQGHRSRYVDDPARLVHDEAERGVRDAADHLAGIRQAAPVRAGRSGPGYAEIFRELEAMLCRITGFAAVSLQPNSGAQGEFAGLMVIRAYLRDQGETERDVCLIPASAHGTNPASAVMAGMHVVVVASTAEGNIDVADLKRKAEEHRAPSGGVDGHLSVHARRVRGIHSGRLRDHSRARRPGVHGRREHERAGRPHQPRGDRRRRVPYQPAQDVQHSARRRRSRHGTDWRGGAPGAVSARAPVRQNRRQRTRFTRCRRRRGAARAFC